MFTISGLSSVITLQKICKPPQRAIDSLELVSGLPGALRTAGPTPTAGVPHALRTAGHTPSTTATLPIKLPKLTYHGPKVIIINNAQ